MRSNRQSAYHEQTALPLSEEHRPTNRRNPTVCHFYAEYGECKFGDRCRFAHVESLPMPREQKDATVPPTTVAISRNPPTSLFQKNVSPSVAKANIASEGKEVVSSTPSNNVGRLTAGKINPWKIVPHSSISPLRGEELRAHILSSDTKRTTKGAVSSPSSNASHISSATHKYDKNYTTNTASQRQRYRGVVQSVKQKFGFIRVPGEKNVIFFHFNDVKDDIELRENDEVEFELWYTPHYKDGKEPCATNVILLGRLSFMRSASRRTAPNNKESEVTESEVKKEIDAESFLPAWMHRVLPSKLSSTNDTTISLKETNVTSRTNATLNDNVRLSTTVSTLHEKILPSSPPDPAVAASISDLDTQEVDDEECSALERRRERGEVRVMKDTFGFIKYSGGESLFFPVREVEGGLRLQKGDKVDFFISSDPKSPKNLMATSVRLLSAVDPLINFRLGNIVDVSPSQENTSDRKDDTETRTFHKSSKRTKFPNKVTMMKWIEEIRTGDVTTNLLLRRNELEDLLNRTEVPFSVMKPLLTVLTDIEVRGNPRMEVVFRTVLKSNFVNNPRNLRSFILRLSNTKFPKNDEIEAMHQVLNLVDELLERFPMESAASSLPFEVLEVSLDKIVKVFPEPISSSVQRILAFRKARKKSVAVSLSSTHPTPRDDFRDVTIFPMPEEMSAPNKETETVQRLPRNTILGQYDNVMDYLSTHFWLLREDCLTAIREGIRAFRTNQMGLHSTGVQLYCNVRFVGLQCTSSGIVYRISFEMPNNSPPVVWERSKKLIYGSLLCLSPDGFATLLWATVANRDVALLSSKKQIDIRFPHGYETNFKPDNVYTMVESISTYFEAYQHVLYALQRIEPNAFPFKDYLVHCKKSISPPSYLKPGNDTYTFENVFDGGKCQFPILGKWPSIDTITTTMDESQLVSLKQALTKELALIQGPPGTGKTFVGLKVMRALLDNGELRGTAKKPILVICYTNHALDQFLEGVLKFEDKVVRIGSRSRSELLKSRNLRTLVFQGQNTGREHQKARKLLNQRLRTIQENITEAFKELNKCVLSLDDLLTLCKGTEVMETSILPDSKAISTADKENGAFVVKCSERQVRSLFENREESESEILESWLGMKPKDILATRMTTTPRESRNESVHSGVTKSVSTTSSTSNEQKVEVENQAIDDIDDELIMKMQLERMVGDDDEEEKTTAEEFPDFETINFELSLDDLPSDDTLQCTDVWSICDRDQRIKLYKYWLYCYRRFEARPNLECLCQEYERLCKEKRVLDEELQVEVLKEAAVIGMTTTGVAKFQRLIHTVQPEIIIVEEAAEVLEGHIIAALSPSTKHLILIGDHQQLRPSTSEYTLAVKYHLDVSLFERLVINGLEHTTLLRQRRMRPAISALLKPIYPQLFNHPDVEHYPHIKGVSGDLFFIDHNVEESQEREGLSKSNKHEATFVARLAMYLLLQGYKATQITVLTPYSGQVKLLRQEFKALDIDSIYITSVDNYQGEENDIIILSLVRSNKQGIIGFLSTSNRICVALSRAKWGFYMIGNATLLETNNKLWHDILAHLRETNCLSSQFVLQCQNHPGKFTKVSKDVDFKLVEDGGCDKTCNQTMECGHRCPRLCHPYPHTEIVCYQPCNVVFECGHACPRRCFEECGSCQVPITRTLRCGHVQNVPCYIKVRPIIIISISFFHFSNRSPSLSHARSERNTEKTESQDESEWSCTAPCEKKMINCGHRCRLKCGEKCPKVCRELVTHSLPCGHELTVECGQDITTFTCTKPHLSPGQVTITTQSTTVFRNTASQ
jgi:cold shock CspA family protein